MKREGDTSEKLEITSIARIHTGFSSKFGIPRQSGIVKELCGKIVFEKPYRSRDWTRGLEGFSHIWAIWLFSENLGESVGATVRPPKLGGNTRMGTFATRSPFRPNFLGMSVLRLERIEYTEDEGTVLFVKGADMLDGTPIVDIKPYLPFADSIPEASGGFAADESLGKVGKTLKVDIPEDILQGFPSFHLDELKGILSQDPRPSYIEDPDRVFAFEFYGKRIRFRVENDILYITEIESVD